jgi:hypothetical protein
MRVKRRFSERAQVELRLSSTAYLSFVLRSFESLEFVYLDVVARNNP